VTEVKWTWSGAIENAGTAPGGVRGLLANQRRTDQAKSDLKQQLPFHIQSRPRWSHDLRRCALALQERLDFCLEFLLQGIIGRK
jgi:hypothetical protein